MFSSSNFRIQKVAVLGGGVMGMNIAAHFANSEIPVVLFSRKPKEASSHVEALKILQERIDKFKKTKPLPFYSKSSLDYLTVATLEDDLEKLKEADWVIETIVENSEAKAELYQKIIPFVSPSAILSTNTSSLSVNALAKTLQNKIQQRFLGVHFFNPVRYLKLIEITPAEKTDKEISQILTEFGEQKLGKRIVIARDTPNFIANRIGIFSMMQAVKLAITDQLTVAEVDQITGEVIGRPKSGTFRSIDLVGIDTAILVSAEASQNLPEKDAMREMLQLPDFFSHMVEKNWLGQKTNQGFYKKVEGGNKGDLEMLNLTTLEYEAAPKIPFSDLKELLASEDLPTRLRLLFFSRDRVGEFVRQHLSAVLYYAVSLIPEISADITSIDNALRWGYGWQMGPFEICDVLGVGNLIKFFTNEGKKIPSIIQQLIASGEVSFYRETAEESAAFNFSTNQYVKISQHPQVLGLPKLKKFQRPILKNASASLVDLGDGVVCFELHSKLNTLNEETIELLNQSINLVEKNYEGLIIASSADYFSAGADLNMLLKAAEGKYWKEIEERLRIHQNVLQRLRYSSKPVVAALRGLALGGGCELALACDRIVAAPELYIGLVEMGVGLVPAGGGCKELLRRIHLALPEVPNGDMLPFMHHVFENVTKARVATSALQAREFGFLNSDDKIVANEDFLLHSAKQIILGLQLQDYIQPKPINDLRIVGEAGYPAYYYSFYNAREANWISDYDQIVIKKIVDILCGGKLSGNSRVSEQYILDLEREAFMSLIGEDLTLIRIRYMLEYGKPLRN
ncbi:MAG: 3-hydroxyacyl-CoA dehydrogenase NAD-binding domain-containing protein [Candidatus Gracilibacteria bacterium]|nr:3-hydroxyacyl-CoA dehydrogenase NAD-binding domain-containing protein [Candidatus Gracilibacteria bacterium]MDD5178922.1 3-hydroxyacyl-CoA dehydrogenase NAD-binding domain-containing protein [Candidatus Gracilibacteria bacterium]